MFLDFLKSKKQRTEENLEKQYFKAVYGVLVMMAGADIERTNAFVNAHLSRGERDVTHVCREWRFCGEFGTGGKYWRERNAVSYYDEIAKDPELELLQKEVNDTLRGMYLAYRLRGLQFVPRDVDIGVNSGKSN